MTFTVDKATAGLAAGMIAAVLASAACFRLATLPDRPATPTHANPAPAPAVTPVCPPVLPCPPAKPFRLVCPFCRNEMTVTPPPVGEIGKVLGDDRRKPVGAKPLPPAPVQ